MTWLFRAGALGLAVMIVVFSLEPASDVPGPFYADKIQHFLAYGGLAFLIGLGWPRWSMWRVILLATLFGIGVEIAQGLSDLGRTASVYDALANAIGAGFGVFMANLSLRLRLGRSS